MLVRPSFARGQRSCSGSVVLSWLSYCVWKLRPVARLITAGAAVAPTFTPTIVWVPDRVDPC